MKKRIFGMLLMGAMVIASMSMFTSCKDYDDDINANKAEIASLKAALQEQKTSLEAAIAAAKSEAQTANATLNTKLTELQTLVGNNKTDLENAIKAAVTDSKAYADGIGADALKVAKEYADAAAKEAAATAKAEALEAASKDLADLKALMEAGDDAAAKKASELAAKIDAVDESVNKLIAAEKEERVNALLAVNTQIENIKLQIAALEKFQATITQQVADIAKDLESTKKILEGVKATAEKNAEDIKANKEAIAKNVSAIADLSDALAIVEGKVAGLEDQVVLLKKADAELGTKIDNLEEKLTALITKNATAISEIDAAYKAADAALKSEFQNLLKGYYTKAEVNNLIKDFITSEALAPYAKTAEVTAAIDAALATQKAAMEEQITATLNAYDAKLAAALTALFSTNAEGAAAADVTMSEEAIAALEALKANFNNGINKQVEEQLNVLKVAQSEQLRSLVFRPDTYYGGIEGVSVYEYDLPIELNNPHNAKDLYHYFERSYNEGKALTTLVPTADDIADTLLISNYGWANYHVNPSNANLTGYTIEFYNWNSDLKEPAAKETRAGSGIEGITPVYNTTEKLLEADADYFQNGILTVPFTADAAAIQAKLKKSVATIASLSLTYVAQDEAENDTTVNSDYAIVVPEYGYGLLIGDTSFEDNDDDYYDDVIGYDGGAVNSENLHRSFGWLALATTSPTHTIKYNGSFDITEVLESRCFKNWSDWNKFCTNPAGVAPRDTTIYDTHNNHKTRAAWDGLTKNTTYDGNATIAKNQLEILTAADFEKLGFKYDIQLVDYTLGSTKTSESVHLELLKNEEGHVIAYPRNVTSAGETIKGQTANAACVGRQPIVCIMVRDKDDNIVSFAYMKFRITQDDPTELEHEFTMDDLYVNCKAAADSVTWSEVEHDILDVVLGGMSKATFDNLYMFDYKSETEAQVQQGNATSFKITRVARQYDKDHKLLADDNYFGTIAEHWNQSEQRVEDATTHIIKWSFTADQLKNMGQALKDAEKLEEKDNDWVNKEDISVWVRYAHKPYSPTGNPSDAPAAGNKPAKGNPSLWIKLTIPAGKFHVAKGDMSHSKVLTYWYQLNSKTNSASEDDAYEVRINVPVPTNVVNPDEKVIGNAFSDTDRAGVTTVDWTRAWVTIANSGAAPLSIKYDNFLEGWEDDNNEATNKTTGWTYWKDAEHQTEAVTINRRSNANLAFSEFTKDIKDFFLDGKLKASLKDNTHFNSINDMKLGCEFIVPSTTVGNATFDAQDFTYKVGGDEFTIKNTWEVNGYTGSKYTLALDATHTKVQIIAKDGKALLIDNVLKPRDIVTLNYDNNATEADRQITVLNYVNGEYQDDILNYKSHNDLGERETFTAYIMIEVVNACAPVYWKNQWFNARFLRPLDLDDPQQALAPDAPNDWQRIDLTDALIVKDWREYWGDRWNRTQGKDVKLVVPMGSGTTAVKAFDFSYYQVTVEIANVDDLTFYTDANQGTSTRSDVFTLGEMPTVESLAEAKANYVKTSQIQNLMFERIPGEPTQLRYLNNNGVTGGFHVFVPVTMTYIYGWQTIRQTKWVTVGVTPSVEQPMIEPVSAE